MSKQIKSLSITPVPGGYIAHLELEGGEQAKSITMDSVESATSWASRYAENAQEAHDEPKSPEMGSTTAQISQAPQTPLETVSNDTTPPEDDGKEPKAMHEKASLDKS